MAKGQHDESYTALIIAACFTAFACAIWYLFSIQINTVILTIAKFNLLLLEIITRLGGVGESIASIFAPGINSEIVASLKEKFYRSNPQFLSGAETMLFLEFIGQNIRPFVIILIIWSGWTTYRNQRHRSLRKKYDLDKLLNSASQYYPHLNTVICQDLIKKNPDEGNLAREKTPFILALENDLIRVHDIDHLGLTTPNLLVPSFNSNGSLKKGHIDINLSYSDDLKGLPTLHGRCVLDTNKATTFFKQQLGKKFTSWKEMGLERRGILAICSLFMKGTESGGVAASINLQMQINRAFKLKEVQSLKHLDEKVINEILEQNENDVQFQLLLKRHNYELTLLHGFLDYARTKGKLYTSHLYWVKHTDRPLWYVLESCGSQMPYSEASSVRSHYLREVSVDMGLDEPKIQGAVDGLFKFCHTTEGWLVRDGK